MVISFLESIIIKLSKTFKKAYGRQEVLRRFGVNASTFVGTLLTDY